MELEIGRVIEACDARVLVEPESRDGAVLGLTWDSREVKPGFVYAAIVGERVDGHAFVVSAIEAGAVAGLCTRELDDAALEDMRALRRPMLPALACSRLPMRLWRLPKSPPHGVQRFAPR